MGSPGGGATVTGEAGGPSEGHLGVVQELLDWGSYISDEAVPGAAENGHLEVVRFLLEDDEAPVHGRDEDGYGALHLAAREGHSEVVRLLLDHGVGDIEDALIVAATEDHLEVVQVLLEAGVNVKRALRAAAKDMDSEEEQIIRQSIKSARAQITRRRVM
ncbi:hypothetical protein HK104_010777 [Borealophlyctis nickersoniae]|nr:hypothetical protein HK104_010777 [Borealophlyctis nickersoniae]